MSLAEAKRPRSWSLFDGHLLATSSNFHTSDVLDFSDSVLTSEFIHRSAQGRSTGTLSPERAYLGRYSACTTGSILFHMIRLSRAFVRHERINTIATNRTAILTFAHSKFVGIFTSDPFFSFYPFPFPNPLILVTNTASHIKRILASGGFSIQGVDFILSACIFGWESGMVKQGLCCISFGFVLCVTT